MINKEFIRIQDEVIIDAAQIQAIVLNDINKSIRPAGYRMYVHLPGQSYHVDFQYEQNVLSYCEFEIVKSYNGQYILQPVILDLDY